MPPIAEPYVDPFESLIAESVAQSLEPSDTVDDSKPQSLEPSDTVDDSKPAVDNLAAAETPALPDVPEKPPTMPDGFVAIPKIEGAQTEFKVSDAEGEIEPPALLIDFMANGKARREPLDKVVKLAQWGVYNHERHQQAEAALQSAVDAQTSVQQMQDQLTQMETAVEEMLASDAVYLDAQEKYRQQNTPEAQMAVREQKLAAEQERISFTQAQTQGKDFMDNRVSPALSMIAQSLPSVTEEELAARVLLAANRFTVTSKFGSIIHPDAHQQIAQFIATDLVPWAQQVHDARQAERATVTDTAKQDVAKAQVETQKAKNLVTKAFKPAGRSTPEVKSRAAPRTADEAHDEVLRATFEAMGMR